MLISKVSCMENGNNLVLSNSSQPSLCISHDFCVDVVFFNHISHLFVFSVLTCKLFYLMVHSYYCLVAVLVFLIFISSRALVKYILGLGIFIMAYKGTFTYPSSRVIIAHAVRPTKVEETTYTDMQNQVSSIPRYEI